MQWANLTRMTIVSTTVGKNGLEEMEQSSQSTKESKMQHLVQSQQQQNDLCFQGNPFNITVIRVYARIINVKEAEVDGSMKTYKTF